MSDNQKKYGVKFRQRVTSGGISHEAGSEGWFAKADAENFVLGEVADWIPGSAPSDETVPATVVAEEPVVVQTIEIKTDDEKE